MRKSTSTPARRLARAGLATGAATSLFLAATASPAFAAPGVLTLSQTGGPSGGGNTITATLTTLPTPPNPTQFTANSTAQFVPATTATTACPAVYAAPGSNLGVTGTNLRLLSPTRVAITVPTGVVHTPAGTPPSTSTRYLVCTYAGATAGTGGSALVATGSYTVGARPTIDAVNGVSPTAGPSMGGTTITVTGTGFTAGLTATLGGVALQNIRDITATSFTATTPANGAVGPQLLTISTPGGTASTLGGPNGPRAAVFTYRNALQVSPNTAPNTRPVDIDVMGVGFQSLTFNNAGSITDSNSHVYLVNGAYNPATGSGGARVVNGPVTDCTNIIVISDNELLCTLQLQRSLLNTGVLATAAATRTAAITTTTGSSTITSAVANFTQADVGLAITVPSATQFADTTITAVTSPTTATVGVAANTVVAGTPTATIAGNRAVTADTVASSTTVTGTFTQADVGRVVTGGDLPANTYIVSIGAGGTTAVVSAPAGASAAAGASLTVANNVPVPPDAYTVTVVNDGSAQAQTADTYSQSVVSSGSTFTVSDF